MFTRLATQLFSGRRILCCMTKEALEAEKWLLKVFFLHYLTLLVHAEKQFVLECLWPLLFCSIVVSEYL
nr:hypothetical protein [Neptunomonas japonica]